MHPEALMRVLPLPILLAACVATEPADTGAPKDTGASDDTDTVVDSGPVVDTGPAIDTAGPTPPFDTDPRDGPPNLLFVLFDDVGLDQVASYGLGPAPASMPTLEGLADEGVRFSHAFTAPTCSPTRSLLLTGRYGRRTGIGRTVSIADHTLGLSGHEVGIAEVLREAPVPYATAVVGKWHLVPFAVADWEDHPATLGFDRWSVAPGNLGRRASDGRSVDGYDRWERDEDGVLGLVEGYATTSQVDTALDLLPRLPEPWFLYLSLSAPHSPWHAPPDDLQDGTVDDRSGARAKYQAMLGAADQELGRLLDALPPVVRDRTVVMAMGDNGTPGEAVAPFPALRAKDTLFDLGTRVPLIVAGPGVPMGEEATGLVHAVDVFPTLAELAGVDPEAPGAPWPDVIDGESLVDTLAAPSSEGRPWVYTEAFAPNGVGLERVDDSRAVRDADWRLVRTRQGLEQLYRLGDDDLRDGPDELAAAMPADDALAARDRLGAILDALTAELGSP